jgi:trehalose 2-sulfotransferase
MQPLPVQAPSASYIVAATARSGSNFLCEVLQRAEIGNPDEYFWNPPHWYDQWKISQPNEYIEEMIRLGTASGVFGLKILAHDLDEAGDRVRKGLDLEGSNPEVFARAFPNLKYILLTRRDKIRQAISLHRAHQTKAWRSTEQEQAAPTYDLEMIDLFLDSIVYGETEWQNHLNKSKTKPLTIVFEDFISDPVETARKVARFLGLSAPDFQAPSEWRLGRQADSISEEWVARYLEEKHEEFKRLP